MAEEHRAHTAAGDAYVQSIFDGLHDLNHNNPARLNVEFADFSRIWDRVLSPDHGCGAFSYTSTNNCYHGRDGSSGAATCDDPEHYFYWFAG